MSDSLQPYGLQQSTSDLHCVPEFAQIHVKLSLRCYLTEYIRYSYFSQMFTFS